MKNVPPSSNFHVNLKMARRIETDIHKLIQERSVKRFIATTDLSTKDIRAEVNLQSNKFNKHIDELGKLVNARWVIRKKIGEANHEYGIDRLMTDIAEMDQLIDAYNSLIGYNCPNDPTSEDTIVRTIDKRDYVTSHGTNPDGSEVRTTALPMSFLTHLSPITDVMHNEYTANIRYIERKRSDAKDTCAALNSTTKVDLNEIREILQQYNLI